MPEKRIVAGFISVSACPVAMSAVATARRIAMPRNISHTTHPVMASFEPGERWAWCYVDQMDLDVPPRFAQALR